MTDLGTHRLSTNDLIEQAVTHLKRGQESAVGSEEFEGHTALSLLKTNIAFAIAARGIMIALDDMNKRHEIVDEVLTKGKRRAAKRKPD